MTQMNDNTTNSFLQQYQITVVDNNKRCQRGGRIQPQYFLHQDDKDMFEDQRRMYDTEPLLTVTIPQSRLTDLIELESKFFNHMREMGGRHMFAVWSEQQREERLLREQYQSVKDAYEQYSLMLHLTKHNK